MSESKKIITYDAIKLVIAVITLIFCLIYKELTFIKYVYIGVYVLLAYDLFIKAFFNIIKGNIFDENLLMIIATLGALFLGENFEAIMVVILYKIGEELSDKAVDNSKDAIVNLLNTKKTKVERINNNEIEEVYAIDLKVDDIVLIKPGDKIPIDGIILEGKSNVDKSSLTGESIPEDVQENDEVYADTINLSSNLKVRVTKKYEDTQAAKIISILENASEVKAKPEKFINKFSKVYTPVVLLLALAIVIISIIKNGNISNNDAYVALSFLVVSCPCALVISIPLVYFMAIGNLSKKGILVKGANYIDSITLTKNLFLDKTGTLTSSKIEVEDVVAIDIEKEKLLKYFKSIERHFSHPVANAIKNYTGNIELIENYERDVTNIPGLGVSALVENQNVLIGNKKLLQENNIEFENEINNENLKNLDNGIVCFLVIDRKIKGYITLKDKLKKSSIEAIKVLKEKNILSNIIMLTGDRKENAKAIADELEINFYSDLLPLDKVEKLKNLKIKDKLNMFVGDGVNDSAVLVNADIGIAMGKIGSDIAIESSDIVLLNDNLMSLISLFDVSKFSKKIVIENIVFSILIKMIALIMILFGMMNMLFAVIADVGVTLVAILNAYRIMRK